MPNNCDVGDVRAKFQGDKLYVLLPKLIVPADDDAQTPPKMAATESPPGSGGNDTPRPKESSVVDAREEKKKKKQQQLEGEIEYGSNGMGLSEGSKMTLLVNVENKRRVQFQQALLHHIPMLEADKLSQEEGEFYHCHCSISASLSPSHLLSLAEPDISRSEGRN
ncbi:hypothetical protein OPV22_033022 [Ensete ventricosum]|uniref:SHSP domain-containing protein n=1 Tax=Ensete ventricosum TaxID=4639 RepID=A0AAV8PNW2_ENSVE|nr:hypothetical protein OPV22_033022 [Ensete ventricosum]